MRGVLKGRYVLNCYGCDKKCQDGYKACKNITDEHRARVAKLDAEGVFWKKKPSGNETKQGTVNVVAGNDNDDNGGDDSATKTTGTPSELTDDQPPYEQLYAIAKLAGVVNANVGTSKKLEDICEDDFSWDGDVLADLGGRFHGVSKARAGAAPNI